MRSDRSDQRGRGCAATDHRRGPPVGSEGVTGKGNLGEQYVVSRIYTGAHPAEPLVFKRVSGRRGPFHDTVADFAGWFGRRATAGCCHSGAKRRSWPPRAVRTRIPRWWGEEPGNEPPPIAGQAERLANAAAEVLAAGPRIRREAERSLVQLLHSNCQARSFTGSYR